MLSALSPQDMLRIFAKYCSAHKLKPKRTGGRQATWLKRHKKGGLRNRNGGAWLSGLGLKLDVARLCLKIAARFVAAT